LNSAELNQVLNGTTGDTPGSPDEFSTPLQDFERRGMTNDGKNSKSDGTNKPLLKVLFINPSEPNDLVGARATRLEVIPETLNMR
jgi:hypothetical protein